MVGGLIRASSAGIPLLELGVHASGATVDTSLTQLTNDWTLQLIRKLCEEDRCQTSARGDPVIVPLQVMLNYRGKGPSSSAAAALFRDSERNPYKSRSVVEPGKVYGGLSRASRPLLRPREVP